MRVRSLTAAVAVLGMLAACTADVDERADAEEAGPQESGSEDHADTSADADAQAGADPQTQADPDVSDGPGEAGLSEDERLDQIWTAAEGWQHVWQREMGEAYGGIAFDPRHSPPVTLKAAVESEGDLERFEHVVEEFPFSDEVELVVTEQSLNDRLLDLAIARNRGTLGEEPIEMGESQEPTGYRVDSPPQITVFPPELIPGEDFSVYFPTRLSRGVGFALERLENGRWEPGYYLGSGQFQGGSPSWSDADDYDNGWPATPDVAVSGLGPDPLPMPDTIEEGRWRLCASGWTSPCSEIDIAFDAD